MTPEPQSLTLCERHEQATQRFLDGDPDAFDSAIESHRVSCDLCRGYFQAASWLASGLSRLGRPTPSPDLTERLVSAVLSDAPRPSSRNVARPWLAILAIAASLVLAVALGLRFSANADVNRGNTAPPQIATTVPPAVPVALEQSLAEASTAVATLTRRTADETVEPAKAILSSAADSAVLKTKPEVSHSANDSLSTIRTGAALGIEPVADSARRAVSLFMRDLTVDSQRKGGL